MPVDTHWGYVMHGLKSFVPVIALLVLLSSGPGLFGQPPAGPAAVAQTGTATNSKLSGTVKDPTGAVMKAVDVAVLQGTTVVKAAKTDAEGLFSFSIPVGQYQLIVATPDFKPQTQPIRVVANMPALEITLSLAGITSVVEVTADSRTQLIIDASQSLDATVLTQDQINDLPDDQDALLEYLQLLAGGGGNAQLIIDGFEGGRLPTRDQIAQIIIEPNSFNANGTGPRITVVSRVPGGTRWDGNASFNYRDSALNARNPGAANKPPMHQTVVSVREGGPVIKGKLAMSVNASKEQSESGNSSIHAVTPDGPVNTAYVSPSTYDSLGVSGTWYKSKTNTLNFNLSFNRNKNLNSGIGGFTLIERASDSFSHGYNFQIADNKTLSSKMTNTFQFRMNRNNNRSQPRTNAVAINVLDAFNGGGAQNHSDSHNASYNLQDTLRWTPNAKWNLQFSLNANYQRNSNLSENNYLGTFTFSSLADYLAGHALSFRQTSGNPLARTEQFDANTSFQITYRIKQTMSFSAGAQYALQTHFNDYNNVSPTMQFQAQVKKRTVISGGARLSYPNVPFGLSYYEQLIRGDGTIRQFNTEISNPSYPDPFAGGVSAITTGTGSTLQRKDKNLTSPYAINSQISLTETLPKNWRISTNFNFTRQVHQIRNRNINAPYPGTPLDPLLLTRDQIDMLKPFYPLVSRINQFESTGNSLQKNFNFNVQLPSTKKYFKTQFAGQLQYGYGWGADDNGAQNPYNVRADWASNDQRHRFQGTIQIRPPWIGSFSINGNANSGRVYSVTTGKDDNLDQSINDRPAGVPRNSMRGAGGYTLNLNYNSPNLSLHRKKPEPKAATPAPAGTAASSAANTNAQIDALIQSALAAGLPASALQQIIAQASANPALLASVLGSTPAASTNQKPPSLMRPRVYITVNIQNVLNHTRVNGYSGVITSPLFGKPTGWGSGRSIYFTINEQF